MADDSSARLYQAFVSHDPGAAINVVERAKKSGVAQAQLFDQIALSNQGIFEPLRLQAFAVPGLTRNGMTVLWPFRGRWWLDRTLDRSIRRQFVGGNLPEIHELADRTQHGLLFCGHRHGV